MTNAKTPALPEDLYVPQLDAGTEYQQLEHAGSEARYKRMDIIYQLHLDELRHGKAGVAERVGKRLHLDTGLRSSRITIGDSVRIFELFRLTGEDGLGYTREQLAGIPFSRQRTLAGHKAWALRHRDEVETVLQKPEEGEDGMRAYIAESVRQEAEAAGEDASPRKPSFVDRAARFTAEDAGAFDTLLAVIANKMAAEGKELSDKAGIARGQMLSYALLEWLQFEQQGEDETGQPIVFTNAMYWPEDADHAAD